MRLFSKFTHFFIDFSPYVYLIIFWYLLTYLNAIRSINGGRNEMEGGGKVILLAEY